MHPVFSSLYRHRIVVALAAILVLALITRIWNIASAPLWTDELYSVSFARTPLHDLWGDWMVREPNPPLYYSLLSGWVGMFGETELAVRFLSVIFGLLGITAVFLIGRSLHSPGAGLLAACLAAVSSHQLQYSQEARAYILAFAAAGFAIVALARLTDHWRNNRFALNATGGTLTLYAVSVTVAVYAHTTLLLLPILANFYVLALWVLRPHWVRASATGWVAANLIIGLLCAWWLWVTFRQVTSGMVPVSWIESTSLTEAISRTAHIVGTRSIDGFNLPIALVTGAVMALGVSRLSFEKRVLAIVFGVGIPAAMFLISLAKPVFLERTLLWAQAIYIPCLAIGLLSLPLERLRVIASAAVVLLLAYDSVNWAANAYHEPWDKVASELSKQTGPDDAILVYDADVPENLRFYQRTAGLPRATFLAMQAPAGKVLFADRFKGAILQPSELPAALQPYSRIFVVQRGLNDAFDEDPTDQMTLFASQVGSNLLGADKANANELRLTIWQIP